VSPEGFLWFSNTLARSPSPLTAARLPSSHCLSHAKLAGKEWDAASDLSLTIATAQSLGKSTWSKSWKDEMPPFFVLFVGVRRSCCEEEPAREGDAFCNRNKETQLDRQHL
jgi:hypothetical protein